MRKYKLFIGYRLLGEFSGIWEAKISPLKAA